MSSSTPMVFFSLCVSVCVCVETTSDAFCSEAWLITPLSNERGAEKILNTIITSCTSKGLLHNFAVTHARRPWQRTAVPQRSWGTSSWKQQGETRLQLLVFFIVPVLYFLRTRLHTKTKFSFYSSKTDWLDIFQKRIVLLLMQNQIFSTWETPSHQYDILQCSSLGPHQ
jgi:hypothetical protein